MSPLLLTRPHDDSSSLAGELEQAGIAAIISPALHIEPLSVRLETEENAEYTGLILTSRHAVHACDGLAGIPVYVVGEHTAQHARARGLTIAAIAPSAAQLLPLMPPQGKYIYASGAHISCDFAQHLPHADVKRVVVYHAHAAESLTPEAARAWQKGATDSAVFYSMRSATITTALLQALRPLPESGTAYCISAPVAAECRRLGWKHTEHPVIPDHVSMLAMLRAHPK